MPLIEGYLNIYRSGFFHRSGKPNTCDRHGGDFYLNEAAAKGDIEPISHYITTVRVLWEENEMIEANPCNSVPRSLRETRREGEHA